MGKSKQKALRKIVSLPATAALLICTVFALAATKTTPVVTAASAVFTPDKGKLTIQLDGQAVGSEQFELSQAGNDWVAKGVTEITLPGTAATRVSGTLKLQPDGAPISYEWSSRADKTNGAHITFSNGVAKITLEMQGARPYEQDLTFNAPLIAVLDNNLYHHYELLARMYDWSKRGTQTFPVLIPQDLTPGSISVEATGAATHDGKNYEGLRVTTTDLEVLLMLDNNHRMMRLEVPSAKVSVVRE
jgi:hypothetical protein